MQESTTGIGHRGIQPVKVGIAFLPLILTAIQWCTDSVPANALMMDVPTVQELPFLETAWSYAYLHILTFVPVFLLSFDRKVHYYTRWKHLFPAILIVGVIFILWDVFFTVKGVWGFNPFYLLNIHILHLPLEEWLFFITVPFACVFIYECLNAYVDRDWLGPFERWLTPFLAVFFLLIGLLAWGRLYTSTTFLLTGGFLLFHWLFVGKGYRSRAYFAYLVSLIPFLLVNGVLTGGYTQHPIVIYNPHEYLGLRITSIPVDDTVYGFLLFLGVVTLYEHFKKNSLRRKK